MKGGRDVKIHTCQYAQADIGVGRSYAALGPRRWDGTTKDAKYSGKSPKLDLNTASLDQQQKLPGLNEATAKKIIAGRPFKSVDELEKVGLSKPTIDKLAPTLAVGEVAKEATPPEAVAKVPPQKGMVWVNTESGIFFREGERWYGKTKEGKFMTEADAKKAGYREAKN